MIYYFHIIFLLKVLERVNFVVKIQTIIIIMYIPWNLYKIICTAVLWEVCKQISACGVWTSLRVFTLQTTVQYYFMRVHQRGYGR